MHISKIKPVTLTPVKLVDNIAPAFTVVKLLNDYPQKYFAQLICRRFLMYCGYCGSNKTALTSQKQISDALFDLMEGKSYTQISISEVCKKAGVSRQTFYSLFKSKDNVVTYILQEDYCCDLSAQSSRPSQTDSLLPSLCREYSSYIVRHGDFIRILVRNDLSYLLYDNLYNSIYSCSCFLTATHPSLRSYAADFVAAGFTSIAKSYILQGRTASASDLYQISLALFEGSLLR